MGGERAVDTERESVAPEVEAPAPPSGGGGGAAAGGAAAATPAPKKGPDEHLRNWLTAIDNNQKNTALAQATSYCSHVGSGARAMAALQGAGKVNAFFGLIQNGAPHDALARALMGQLYARLSRAYKERLMEAQFQITISGTGAQTFTETELDSLYASASALPPGHVTGNASFTNLVRTANSATAEGSYSGSSNTINMRNEANQARYQETFRHEVGHAVDDAMGALTENLRIKEAGWTKYATTAKFVKKVGYGSIPAALQPKVKAAFDAFVAGGGPWDSPGAFEAELKKHITDAKQLKTVKALYGKNTLIDTARGSEGRFYGSAAVKKWAGSGGHNYFINFYYHNVFSVTSATHTDLASRGNAAACFSDKEWFAEMYQEYYRTATPGTGSFPKFVKAFFKKHIESYVAGSTPSGGGGHPAVPRG